MFNIAKSRTTIPWEGVKNATESKSGVLSTKDYSIFNRHYQNDVVELEHLKKIEASVKECNMLEEHPIIVNKNMEILDGLHRFIVARDNGLALYYTFRPVNDKVSDEMIIRENNVALRSWKLSRYLDFYVKGGHSEYVKLQSFIDEHDLSITLALSILKNIKGGFYSKFKAGLYKYPDETQISIIEDLLIKVEATKKMLRKLVDIKEQTLKTASITTSLITLFRFPGIIFSTFKKHLEYNLGSFRRCSNVTDYIKQFVDIYNWRERTPIEVNSILAKTNKEKD